MGDAARAILWAATIVLLLMAAGCLAARSAIS